jgi:hypothetical protein
VKWYKKGCTDIKKRGLNFRQTLSKFFIFRFLYRTPDGTRTHDLLLRRQLLYPTELPRHPYFFLRCKDRIQIPKNKSKISNKSKNANLKIFNPVMNYLLISILFNLTFLQQMNSVYFALLNHFIGPNTRLNLTNMRLS